jgi:hypothetical protein
MAGPPAAAASADCRVGAASAALEKVASDAAAPHFGRDRFTFVQLFIFRQCAAATCTMQTISGARGIYRARCAGGGRIGKETEDFLLCSRTRALPGAAVACAGASAACAPRTIAARCSCATTNHAVGAALAPLTWPAHNLQPPTSIPPPPRRSPLTRGLPSRPLAGGSRPAAARAAPPSSSGSSSAPAPSSSAAPASSSRRGRRGPLVCRAAGDRQPNPGKGAGELASRFNPVYLAIFGGWRALCWEGAWLLERRRRWGWHTRLRSVQLQVVGRPRGWRHCVREAALLQCSGD